MSLDRASILAFKTPRVRQVKIEAWGGDLFFRPMTAGQRDRFEAAWQDKKLADFRATLVALSACDASGNRIFRDEDVKELSELPADGMQEAFNVAMSVNGFTKEDVKELEGN